MKYDERKEAEAFERGLNIGRLEAAKDLAAVEERGRRRGLEERGKEVRDAQRVIAMLVKRLGGEVLLGGAGLLAFDDRTVLETRHDSDGMRIKVLAPRDSGKVCGFVLNSDPFREWTCAQPEGHKGPHSGDRK